VLLKYVEELSLDGLVYGLLDSEGAQIRWPTMLVVGSTNSSPGPTLSISLHQYRVPRKEYV
jgi:hypothetical protein